MPGWTDRVPPYNLEAEQAVLGCMLIEPQAIDAATGILKSGDFYRDAHRLIFEAVVTINDRRDPVDLITLSDELRNRSQLDVVGGSLYLVNLTEAPSSAALISSYASIVQECAIRRGMIVRAKEIEAAAYDSGSGTAQELITSAQSLIMQPFSNIAAEGRTQPIAQVVSKVIDEAEEVQSGDRVVGIKSEFEEFDFLMPYYLPSTLGIIAARSSMGKTALAMQVVTHSASQGYPVLVCSLEMSKEQVVRRMLCSRASVNSHSVISGQMSDGDWDAFATAAGYVAALPVVLTDEAMMTPADVRYKCRQVVSKYGKCGMVMIDYLQLMSLSKQSDNRNLELSSIIRAKKALCKELECPVIVLSQLSREVEKRPNKRPMLSDLRDSGSLESEADWVMMLYRDAYYNHPAEPQMVDTCEIAIEKQRDGKTGMVELGYIGQYTRFVSLDKQHETPVVKTTTTLSKTVKTRDRSREVTNAIDHLSEFMDN